MTSDGDGRTSVTTRTALVTGLTGQDGGYLAEALVAGGTHVHGVRRAGSSGLPAHLAALGDDLTVHETDLADPRAVAELVRRTRPDEIYNLAAQGSVQVSWSEPAATAEVNAVLPARLLEAALCLQEATGEPVRFLQASSAEVFAGSGAVPQDELTPPRPTSPYGAAKLHAHHLVGLYRQRGLHAVSLFLYPHESPRRTRAFVTRKISSTVAAIARGLADELVLGNLDARRDWGWAPDVVEAMLLAVRHPEPEDFVVATGESHTVAEFAQAAFEHAAVPDWQERLRSDPALLRPTDAAHLVGDASRARSVLGWAPRVRFSGVVTRMVDRDLAAPRAELLAR